MRAEPAESRHDGDVGVYAPLAIEHTERVPLLDLRTRLVIWVLILVFFGLVYLGLEAAPV